MKYCSKCGAEMVDEAVFCVKCGCAVGSSVIFSQRAQGGTQGHGLVMAAKVLMILGTVLMALSTFGIALAWCVPLTVVYFNKISRGEPISTGFKVCSLLFVSMIAGILMLCDNNN